ncbi:MAG: MATE family efflux transporter [Fibrobacterota bacterium]
METTPGVDILLGEPKHAVKKISLPIMFTLFIQTLYNIVDGIWVAGIPQEGDKALAAVGVFFPFFMIIMAFAGGIGIGGGATISRKIGAGKSTEAGTAAVLSFLLSFILIGILLSLTYPFLHSLLTTIAGDPDIATMAYRYGSIIFLGSPFLVITLISNSILKAEGDSKRSMVVMSLGAILNTALDPLCIYYFDMGYTGAAWATVIAFGVTSCICIYWIFIQKNTHVQIGACRKNCIDLPLIQDILRVGIPTAFSQAVLSLSIAGIMRIIALVGNNTHLAAYNSCWRILMLINIPAFGLAGSALSVIGAAYGAGDLKKMKETYFYSVKRGMMIQCILAFFVFVFAYEIAYVFSYTEDSAHLRPVITTILLYLSPVFIFSPMGIITSAMFRAVKKGGHSLIASILRTVILQLFFAWLLAIVFAMGPRGVWIGVTTGNLLASAVIMLWGSRTISSMRPMQDARV